MPAVRELADHLAALIDNGCRVELYRSVRGKAVCAVQARPDMPLPDKYLGDGAYMVPHGHGILVYHETAELALELAVSALGL